MNLPYGQKALSQVPSGDGVFGAAAAGVAVGSGSRPA